MKVPWGQNQESAALPQGTARSKQRLMGTQGEFHASVVTLERSEARSQLRPAHEEEEPDPNYQYRQS